MSFRTSKLALKSFRRFVVGLVSTGSLVTVALPARAYLPAYTATDSYGQHYPFVNPSSFGFFFDTKVPVAVDGLGFSYFQNWNESSASVYQVKLWSFVNGGNNLLDYTQIASATFTPGSPYTLQQNYWWQNIAPVILPPTAYHVDPGNLKGYVIAAIGNFSDAPGNVQYESGTPTIDTRFDFGGNGFNSIDDPEGLWSIPYYLDDNLGINAFFNPNFSYVPGPLSVLGIASAFGWTRGIRRRIKSAKQGSSRSSSN